MNLVKPKFVTVQPKSSTAKDHFFNFMNELHSCKVKEENRENMHLVSISGRYDFWMSKENDPNWEFIK